MLSGMAPVLRSPGVGAETDLWDFTEQSAPNPL